MIEELRQRILGPLDAVIDKGIENWRLLAALIPGGTFLFLFLFLVFGVSGWLVFGLFFLLALTEIALCGGVFLLDIRYRQQIDQWLEAADAIEALISKDDVFSDWEQFSTSPSEDPDLEEIRLKCIGLPAAYPPQAQGEYCGERGLEVLDSLVRRLRAGIATKAVDEFWAWWRNRRETKRAVKLGFDPPPVRPKAGGRSGRAARDGDDDDAVRHIPRMAPKLSPAVAAQRQRADREAAIEARKAEKEEARETKRANRIAKKCAKQEKKLSKAPAKRSKKKGNRHGGTVRQAPHHVLAGDEWVDDEALGVPDAVEEAEEVEEVQEYVPAPAPAAQPKRRGKGGLTEAGAIQMAMRAGFTAHHYDRVQHMLAAQLGRHPSPPEVLQALQGKGKLGKRRKKKQKRRRRTPRVKARKAPPSKAPLVMLLFLSALAGAPFAAWRIPMGNPMSIEGEVLYRALDRAPDLKHELRTYFESMFGNQPVSLVDGPRLYVSQEDYDLCWPESWSDIYDKGYSMRVSAEVRPLLLGGYTVARINGVNRIDPVASVSAP